MVHTKKLPNTKRIAHNKIIDLVNKGKFDSALMLVNKHFKKDSNQYLFFYGWVSQLQQKHSKAINYLEKALLLDPRNQDTLIGLAISYDALGDFNKALECCEHARLLFKNNAKVLFTLATISRKAGIAPENVLSMYIETLTLLVDKDENTTKLLVDTYIGIGSCFLDIRDYNNAEIYLAKAIDIDYYNTLAHKNLSNVYAGLGLIDKAIESTKIAQMSEDAEIATSSIYLEGMLQLAKKNYPRGWLAHEARIHCKDYKAKKLSPTTPLRLSSIKSTDTILVFQEQGIGDTLQFSRYLPMLSRYCTNIDLLIQPNHYVPITSNEKIPSIKSFLELNYGDHIRKVYVQGVDVTPESYDVTVSLMSLPYLFNTTLTTVPPIPKFVTDIRLDNTKYNVGVCWQGSTHHYNDINRSIPADLMLDFINKHTDLSFATLQLETNKDITTLESTLALINVCDIIITVDSMIAHLAAGAGRETWLLLPYSADWRWGMKDSTSEWYPSIKIFRQQNYGDWPAVLNTVSNALKLTKF